MQVIEVAEKRYEESSPQAALRAASSECLIIHCMKKETKAFSATRVANSRNGRLKELLCSLQEGNVQKESPCSRGR
jgi:hypothetical protein